MNLVTFLSSLKNAPIGAKINLDDYSNYESSRSCNGGCYSFHQTLTKIGKDKWEVSYSTSSDFQYCKYTGNFCQDDCENCSQAGYETITSIEVIKRMRAWGHPEAPHFEVKTGTGHFDLIALEACQGLYSTHPWVQSLSIITKSQIGAYLTSTRMEVDTKWTGRDIAIIYKRRRGQAKPLGILKLKNLKKWLDDHNWADNPVEVKTTRGLDLVEVYINGKLSALAVQVN